MKLGLLYELAIKFGREKDPRPKASIDKQLKTLKESYRKLNKSQRWKFDLDSLWNPYTDTRILYGDKNLDIRRILMGVDIGVGEMLLADRIRQKQDLDLVISHHPQGKAYANFYEVMHLQLDILTRVGLAREIAEKLLNDRIKEVERKISSANHNQAVDAGRLLDIPFMCIHTPSDNFVSRFLRGFIDTKKPRTLQNVIDILNNIPEYKQATLNNSGPKIILGEPKKKTGKILVEMTGGTEGPRKVFARISQAGIGTLVCMHLSEGHFHNVKDEYINVIIAGHIASDTLGMNLLLDKLESRQRFEIISCSGFRRLRRNTRY